MSNREKTEELNEKIEKLENEVKWNKLYRTKDTGNLMFEFETYSVDLSYENKLYFENQPNYDCIDQFWTGPSTIKYRYLYQQKPVEKPEPLLEEYPQNQ